MLPHPGFEIPHAFLQPDVRRVEVQDGRLLSCVRRKMLNNQCLQGGDYGWHHSTERGRTITRHLTPVNGYGRVVVPTGLPLMPSHGFAESFSRQKLQEFY